MSLLNYLNENSHAPKSSKDISEFLSGYPSTNPDISLPIKASEGANDWELKKDPEVYVRTYDFDHLREVVFFVNEIYKYSYKIKHSIKILIDEMSVTVSTTTHDYGGVTEQDKKIASMANELYSDTRYLKDG